MGCCRVGLEVKNEASWGACRWPLTHGRAAEVQGHNRSFIEISSARDSRFTAPRVYGDGGGYEERGADEGVSTVSGRRVREITTI